jgi:hypothetical protein
MDQQKLARGESVTRASDGSGIHAGLPPTVVPAKAGTQRLSLQSAPRTALDSRLRGNDGSGIHAGASPTVVPAKAGTQRLSLRSAPRTALDSRLREDDGSGIHADAPPPVVPAKAGTQRLSLRSAQRTALDSRLRGNDGLARRWLGGWLLCAAGLACAGDSALDARAEAIVARANLATRYAGDDGRSAARMLITDRQGGVQQRQFVILRKDVADGGDQHFLLVFNRPADVRGTVFLVNKKTAGEDDRWLYLPALDLEKRIAAGDKRTSFVGSDFYYEDVSGRDPALDRHELVEEGEGRAVIRSTPKDPRSVEYASSLASIDTATWLPIRVEYLDAAGRPLRTLETLQVADVQGHPTIMQSRMSTHASGGHTLLEMRGPVYDIGLDDAVFSPRALRHPPRQWLTP